MARDEVARELMQRRSELRELRRQFDSARARPLNEEEAALAAEVGRVRQRLLDLLGGAGKACGSCAGGCELPEGAFAGGRCCAGTAADVFRDEEIDLLQSLGMRSEDLRTASRSRRTGCLFRLHDGCSLRPDQRPSICIHYICRELMAELAQLGRARLAGELQLELEVAMKRFIAARVESARQRDFEECFGPLARDQAPTSG